MQAVMLNALQAAMLDVLMAQCLLSEHRILKEQRFGRPSLWFWRGG